MRPGISRRLGFKALGIAAALTAWEAASRLGAVPADYVPPASTVVAAAARLVPTQPFLSQLAVTVIHMTSGLALAIILGLALAMATARIPLIGRALAPLVDILRVLPPPAIVPIAIFPFGIGPALFLFIVTFAAIWPIYINASNALAAPEPIQLLTSRSLGYSDSEILRRVRLPAALPEIVTGIRLGAGSALLATIAAEMLAGQTGLGFMLYDAAFSLRVADMFAVILIVGVLGIMLNSAIRLASRSVVGWHTDMTALGDAA